MHPMSVMIKPASANCNLKCKYCFYADEAQNRTIYNYGFMSEEILENTIKLFLQNAKGSCHFAFQGGEPTLAGLSFFEKVIEFEKKYKKPNLYISNAIQTNGTLLDRDWCEFFSKNNFLVGLSLDGIKQTNDIFRIQQNTKGSYNKILRATQLLENYKVEFNILTVVTPPIVHNITTIYNFYKKNKWLYQQYTACMEPLEELWGNSEYSLSPKDYGVFLDKLFQLWFSDLKRGTVIYIRYFNNLMLILKGMQPESCAMTGHCNIQYVVEADGSVFPCDFYSVDEYLLGNISNNNINELDNKRNDIKFIEKSLEKSVECINCQWFSLCRSGCRRDWTIDLNSKSYYCESFKYFFSRNIENLKLASSWLYHKS